MLLGKGAASEGGSKSNIVLAAVLIVVILAAGYMVFRTVTGAGGGPVPSETPSVPPGVAPPLPAPGAPGVVGPTAPGEVPAAGPSGAPPGAAPGAPPGASPAAVAPSAPPAGPAGPAATAAPPKVPVPKAKPQAATAAVAKPSPKRAAAQTQMRRIKVFQNVSISYPASWKISPGAGNASAVFTDGKAVFEVHPPDPKATTAKAIAEFARQSLVRGAPVTSQGASKIAGYDTYWIAVKVGGDVARIVGVDGPTRIVLFEHVRRGSFASYRDVFDEMQAGISFVR